MPAGFVSSESHREGFVPGSQDGYPLSASSHGCPSAHSSLRFLWVPISSFYKATNQIGLGSIPTPSFNLISSLEVLSPNTVTFWDLVRTSTCEFGVGEHSSVHSTSSIHRLRLRGWRHKKHPVRWGCLSWKQSQENKPWANSRTDVQTAIRKEKDKCAR